MSTQKAGEREVARHRNCPGFRTHWSVLQMVWLTGLPEIS